MITNKDVIEQGKIVQHYSIDYNPFTGEQESNGGVENLVMYDHKIYSVLTDFTGSVADASGAPAMISDDADSFVKEMFLFEDPEEVLKAETERQDELDYDEWERWEEAHGIQEDFLRDDEW